MTTISETSNDTAELAAASQASTCLKKDDPPKGEGQAVVTINGENGSPTASGHATDNEESKQNEEEEEEEEEHDDDEPNDEDNDEEEEEDDDDDDDEIEVLLHEEEEEEDDDSDDDDNADQNDKIRFSLSSLVLSQQGFQVLLHILGLALYLIPIWMTQPTPNASSLAVLDELHIVSDHNRDVNGATTLRTIFTNDYWGRPMNSTSSHKSWRPLSIVTFRYLQGGRAIDTLLAHRLVNVITHAAVADLVGILAVYLLPMHADPFLLQIMTKAFFLLHPTHVEVTANAANRPHLLALVCSLVLTQPNLPYGLFVVILLAGFMVCETFLFQVVPVAVTLFCIAYIRKYHGPYQIRRRRHVLLQVLAIAFSPTVLWKMITLGVTAVAYYIMRQELDWLSIPEALIRPAENPFFTLTGTTRLWSYLYVIVIHVAKAWDMDFIGFSHEYGFNCIRPITTLNDPRCVLFGGMILSSLLVVMYLLWRQRRQSVLSMGILLALFYTSWMVPSIVPISGIIKVGTFVSDRIVVASTVAVSIFMGNLASSWVNFRPVKSAQAAERKRQKLIVLSVVAVWFMARRVMVRTTEWMDSITLLESSLRTCPNFAKAHLELSKIYSGLYPQLLNLTKSRHHLQTVERIDPDFCDVHYQFAHVAIQEQSYLEFEERLAQALLCPFTTSSCLPMWQNYWKVALQQGDDGQVSPQARAAQERYNKYVQRINAAIQEQDKKDKDAAQASAQKAKSSPFVLGWLNPRGQ